MMYQETYKFGSDPKNREKGEWIIRLKDNAMIPMVRGNFDYEEYILWLQKGNKPKPASLLPAK